MSTFPGSPKLIKGGLVLVNSVTGGVLSVSPLQYNPDTLSRSFQIKGVGAECACGTHTIAEAECDTCKKKQKAVFCNGRQPIRVK
jgi:hypothetical protein